jgi:pimeloyl-ACP methyl ester carboxylesterase
VPQLQSHADVVAPDLRGFGQSDTHADADPERFYSAPGQARGIIALMDELKIKDAVLGGYDVGSLVAQTVARMRRDLVHALVASPPLPGAGTRILELSAVREFWYTTFNQQKVVEELIDGNPKAVRAYLRHFWEHWSGPNYIFDEARLDHLTEMYSRPGAFTASMG